MPRTSYELFMHVQFELCDHGTRLLRSYVSFIRMNLKRDRLLVQNLVKAPEKDQEERIEKKGKK